MNYSREEFIEKYNELAKIRADRSKYVGQESANMGNLESQKSKELQLYGYELIRSNPNDKQTVCIVYSGLPYSGGIFDELGEEIRNDKLCALLALNNFDRSSYGSIGSDLRSDKDVMFTLANNTDGALSITQFSPELTQDEEFMSEVFAYAYNRQGQSDIDRALYDISRYDSMYKLNLDQNALHNAASKAKSLNKAERRFSKHDTGYASSLNPNILNEVFKGNVEFIESNFRSGYPVADLLIEEVHNAGSISL